MEPAAPYLRGFDVDPFHESVSDQQIGLIFAIMALCQQHTFQILTKRPDRMRSWFGADPTFEVNKKLCGTLVSRLMHPGVPRTWPLPNVWLGVSVEDACRNEADERIPLLLETPAAVRFLSCEPLLGPVDVRHIDIDGQGEMNALSPELAQGHLGCLLGSRSHRRAARRKIRSLRGRRISPPAFHKKPRGIDWVIAGGESGPGAWPMHPDWVRSLRDQCLAAGVPYFFKQWGLWGGWAAGRPCRPCGAPSRGPSRGRRGPGRRA